MTTDLNELAAYYAALTDDELLRRSAKQLTVEARALVDDELRSRGVSSSATVEPQPRAADAAVEASSGVSVELVDIAQFYDPAQAYLLKGYLESFGIPATVIGADVARTFSGVVGGARLSVPKPLVEQAFERVADYNDDRVSPAETPGEGTDLSTGQPVGGRLKTYRVYAHPARATRIVVRMGFNWAALIFGPLWFLLNKMWVNALIFVALILGNSLYVTHAAYPASTTDALINDVLLILYPVVWLLFSVLANTLLCSDLEGKGYALKATVRARNPAYAREEALRAEREN